METNIDIVLSTQSDTSGIDKYEKAIKGAEKATSEFEKVQKSQEQQSKNSTSSIGTLATGLGTLSVEENKLTQTLEKRNKEMGLSITQSRDSIKIVKEITSTISKDFITSQKDTKKAIQETTVAYNEFLATISNQKSVPEITKSSTPSPVVPNKELKEKSTASSNPKIESSSIIPESVVKDVGDKGEDTGDLFAQNFIDAIDMISPEIGAIIKQLSDLAPEGEKLKEIFSKLSDPATDSKEQFLSFLETFKEVIPNGEMVLEIFNSLLDPFTSVEEKIGILAKDIGGLFGEVGSTIGSTIQQMLNPLTSTEEKIGILAKDIGGLFGEVGGTIGSTIQLLLDPLLSVEEKIGILSEDLGGLFGDVGSIIGSTIKDLIDPLTSVEEKLMSVSNSVFGLLGSFASKMGDSIQQSLEPFNDQIDLVNEKYDEMSENIAEQKEALEEQDQEIAESSEEREVEKSELKEEREVESIEAELSRLSEKENVFLTAEEHKKKAELKKNLELIKSEQKKAKEKEKLDNIDAENEKKRKAEIAEIKFKQETADWENQKGVFEANKKQTIFASATAMVKAPVDAALSILRGGAEGGPIGATAMSLIAVPAAASALSSAMQLSDVASSTFDVPAPVKAMYTGGVVPLNEGAQFMIGGRMGAEEMATVKGDSLYIDNAVQTSQKEYSNSSSIIIQNMVIQTNDPEDFADSLVNQMREEQYV